MRNILVLGGTGMLQGLVLKLLDEPQSVFVVARHTESLQQLEAAAGDHAQRLTRMAMDYHDVERLAHWVAHIQLMQGPLDQVVAWVHGDAQPVLAAVDHEVFLYRRSPWDLFHVVGSRAAFQPPELPPFSPNCRYHQVILGFQRDPQGPRWLTHPEIVNGVLGAMARPADRTIVGAVEPYGDRPR